MTETEKVAPGCYHVKDTENRRGNPVSVFVMSGEYINDSRSYGLGGIMDVKVSPWYVVEVTELLANYDGGTYVVDKTDMQSSHDTKKKAVKRAA